MAQAQQVRCGPARILPRWRARHPSGMMWQIERVSLSQGGPQPDTVIRVTDPQLLSSTGGIVQGMSGSPIEQDGKLVGAVTHVLVNDPTRGYGNSATMPETADILATQGKSNAA